MTVVRGVNPDDGAESSLIPFVHGEGMTAVRSVRSTKYGAKLFAYVLLVVAVGGALFGLGYSLAWPGLAAVTPGPPPVEEPATVAAGAALALLGFYVLGAGLLATLNKLVADSVAMGVAGTELSVASERAASSATESDAETEGQEASNEGGRDTTPSSPEPDRGPTPGSARSQSPASAAGTGAGAAADRSDPPAEAADGSTGSEGVEPPAPGGNGGEGGGQEAAETGASDPSGGSDPGPDAAAAEADAGTAGGSDAVTVDVDGADTLEPSVTGPVTTGPESDAEAEESDAGNAGSADAGPAGADFGDDTTEAGRPVGSLETEPVDPESGSGSDSGPNSDADEGDPSGPREPSPEEIAFGSSGADLGAGPDDDTGARGGVTERADWFEEGSDEESEAEPTDAGESTGKSERPEAEEAQGASGVAGSTAPSDPLADPNEDG